MKSLKSLQNKLTRALEGRPRQLGWGYPEAMQNSLARVRERFNRKSSIIPAKRVVEGVMALRIYGKNADFVRVKYACYGIAQHADLNGRRLLEDATLVKKLLDAVEAQRPNTRRFAACCRGLRRSWQEASTLPKLPATRAGRTLLKDFLASCESPADSNL